MLHNERLCDINVFIGFRAIRCASTAEVCLIREFETARKCTLYKSQHRDATAASR